MTAVVNEQDLVRVAIALIGSRGELSPPERRLCNAISPLADRSLLARYRKQIRADGDPLGEAFSRIRSPATRRASGATYTPRAIVRSMVRWAAAEARPSRVVDAGAGSGRFLIAAAKAFPEARLLGIEMDPLAALTLRANAAVLGLKRRCTILVKDYREVRLPTIPGPTLFLGNPPYVRHHDIEPYWKDWLARSSASFGFRASRLAGLHVHFFIKTMEMARPGDFGAFITSAEWLDVNYGAVLRHLLEDGMGGVSLHVLDPKAMPFNDAATTGAICCFRVGRRPASLLVNAVKRVGELGTLAKGRPIPWQTMASASRWSTIIRPGPALPHGFIELGEICRVHRGQVTGDNRVWIVGEHAQRLPDDVLKPTVTKARELLKANGTLSDPTTLRRVVDLPEDLDELESDAQDLVQQFLRWAKAQGAHESYIARHRQPWWSVKLRQPAPIICTYMARRPPAFVRNLCGARHINIAHGLYPRQAFSAAVLDALAVWLNNNVGTDSGRTYAGGLTKFEPKELERVRVPRPETLNA